MKFKTPFRKHFDLYVYLEIGENYARFCCSWTFPFVYWHGFSVPAIIRSSTSREIGIYLNGEKNFKISAE